MTLQRLSFIRPLISAFVFDKTVTEKKCKHDGGRYEEQTKHLDFAHFCTKDGEFEIFLFA